MKSVPNIYAADFAKASLKGLGGGTLYKYGGGEHDFYSLEKLLLCLVPEGQRHGYVFKALIYFSLGSGVISNLWKSNASKCVKF